MRADVDIQGIPEQIDVANDFYTENFRRLSKCGHFSEVDLRKNNYSGHIGL